MCVLWLIMDQDKIRTRGHEENMCVVCSFASLLEINKWEEGRKERQSYGFPRGSPLCDDQFMGRRLSSICDAFPGDLFKEAVEEEAVTAFNFGLHEPHEPP